MKWSNSGITQYMAAREYIDTAIIPLVPVGINKDDNMRKSALQQTTMQIFSNELEKELAGRLLMLPSYTYLTKKDLSSEANRLAIWLEDLESVGFKYVFLMTFDPVWRKYHKGLSGELIWIPCSDGSQMEGTEFQHAIRGQARDVIDLMKAAWDEKFS